MPATKNLKYKTRNTNEAHNRQQNEIVGLVSVTHNTCAVNVS